MFINRIIVLALVFWVDSAGAIEISDFKFGLLCPDLENNSIWICHETKEITVTGQAMCKYNDERVPCTWYGFSFNYTNHADDEKIECVTRSSLPVVAGNPKGKDEESNKKHKYTLELKDRNGYFINPQYIVFSTRSEDRKYYKHKTKCSVKGETLYQFEFTATYPVK